MFATALKYPLSGTDAAKTILIGGLLTLLGVLLVPLVVVAGYTVRVARDVLTGDEQAPPFGQFRALAGNGLKAVGIGIAYFAPAALLLSVTGLVVLIVFDSGPGRSFLAGGLALAGVVFAGLLFLAGWYVGAAGFVNFAATGRLRAAFAIDELWPVLTNSRYAVSWVFAVGLLMASSAVTALLEFLPVGIGTVLGAFVAFYATVAISYLHARGVAAASDPAVMADTTQAVD